MEIDGGVGIGICDETLYPEEIKVLWVRWGLGWRCQERNAVTFTGPGNEAVRPGEDATGLGHKWGTFHLLAVASVKGDKLYTLVWWKTPSLEESGTHQTQVLAKAT